jgi:hypothetical protein
MGAGRDQGFAGSVSATSVAEVLQFQRGNRFSGSIVFECGGQQASVYLHAGEVVHAEAGNVRGEQAIRAILSWPSGNFQAHANVTSVARTIDKRLEHLLLDSLRQIDEERTGLRPLDPAATPAPAGGQTPRPASTPPSAALKAQAVAGATYAVVLRGGQPLRDGSPRAEALAARSTYLLSVIAGPLARALGLGEMSSACHSSPDAEQLLLFRSQEAHLAVSVAPGTPLLETEAAVRRALGSRPPG